MVEIRAHGQELTKEFLDHLFVSIINDIPDKKWIEIKKNHDQAKAGIKHLIDVEFYGEPIDVVFNNEFTHFKKRLNDIDVAHPFEGLYIDDTACTRYCSIVANEEVNAKRAIERERKKNEIEKYKTKKRGRKR